MSLEAPNWYVNQYVDKAVHVYQAKGNLLRGTVSPPVKVDAKQVTWMIAGKGEAVPLQRGGFGPAMNAARTNVTATMADYQANDWVYETDLEKMTVDEQAVVSQTCGMAMGRKSDLLVMNELNTVPATLVDATGGNSAAHATSPFTLVMALAGMTALENADVSVEDGGVYCGLPPLAWQQFTSYRQVNDADWVGYDGLPYKTGMKFKDWNGVKWFRIPLSYCPVFATSVIDFFMWHKSAVGFGTNYELRSTVTWENLYTGWYHNNRFAAAVKTLLPAGVIRFRIGSDSPISIN